MPVKAKHRKPQAARWQYRLAAKTEEHPYITYSSIGSIIIFLIGIGPILLWAFNFYETAADAKVMEAKILTQMAKDKTEGLRIAAWDRVTIANGQLVPLKNRDDDCKIREDKRALMTRLEIETCNDYHQRYNDALRRAEQLRMDAEKLSRIAPP